MKKSIKIIIVLLVMGIVACDEYFIEKPAVTGLNQDEVFSTAKNAERAIAEAYGANLSSGLPVLVWFNVPGYPVVLPYETTESIIGGEDLCKISWSYHDKMCAAGMIADNSNQGVGYSDGVFANNYLYIRKAWHVFENIDKVSDMTDAEKAVVKGEMQVLVAFRYLEMLKRYGGVPIVEETLTATDIRERATVQETLDYILSLCNEAAIALDGMAWDDSWLGRVNKGVALAVKAEALTYAARPLFNANEPYMQMDDPANNNMLFLGNKDDSRWQDAIDANLAVISWGAENGFELIDTDNPLQDYGTAVGTPSNKEVLLAYKQQRQNDDNGIYKNITFLPTETGHDLSQYRGVSYEQLLQYRKTDGTDQVWVDQDAWEPAESYREKAESMEPRALASLFFFGISPKNNTGNNRFDVESNWQLAWRDEDGCAKNCKFWYEAGSREWFEFPIYRMAEFYLNIAEAYNELDNSSESLKYLNIIRNRGGLPNETVTDQAGLRKSIQREWAVEFYAENQHYPHARHWKLGETMIGGPKHSFRFSMAAGISDNPRTPEEYQDYTLVDAYVANYAWHNYMSLSPFQLSEVVKGYLVQNPGY